jgi:hypothetical protein
VQQVAKQMEATLPFETLVYVRTTWQYIPGDDNFHNYRCENLKSYEFHSVQALRLGPLHVQVWIIHPPILPISDTSFLQLRSYPHCHNKPKKLTALLTAGSIGGAACVSFLYFPRVCSLREWGKESDKIRREDDNVSRRVKQGQRIIWQSHRLIRSDGCAGRKITPVACEIFVVLADGTLEHGNFFS